MQNLPVVLFLSFCAFQITLCPLVVCLASFSNTVSGYCETKLQNNIYFQISHITITSKKPKMTCKYEIT